MRLYDPEEGEILLDGHDIRTLKTFDLRQAISVLFQDYTHFPLSVRPIHPCLRVMWLSSFRMVSSLDSLYADPR